MKPSLERKLQQLAERLDEVSMMLSEPKVIQDQNQFRQLSQEYSSLNDVVAGYRRYQKTQESFVEAENMCRDSDPEMRALGQEERASILKTIEELEQELQVLLLPKDPNDHSNIFLEIRAGTGGNEASIFAGDLFRMYSRYAETRGWRVEVVSASEGEQGGFKEVISRILGNNVFEALKFESGAHRVQRVPTTESQGRIHTSACTVAILPEVEDIESIDIDKNDLRIDTFRSSGAGGQHVNTTDSAIRITHLPTGVVVECQDERSQHKNKAKALALLQARLLAHARETAAKERSQQRRNLVGSGDRSERIRTYNFPQGRLTDHRVNLTLYQLDDIMEGHLAPVLDVLRQEHQADLLAEFQGESGS